MSLEKILWSCSKYHPEMLPDLVLSVSFFSEEYQALITSSTEQKTSAFDLETCKCGFSISCANDTVSWIIFDNML